MSLSPERKNEVIAILLFVISIITFLSLISAGGGSNYIGLAGYYYSRMLLYTFGLASYFIIFISVILSLNKFRQKETEKDIVKFSGALLLLISLTLVMEQFVSGTGDYYAGGIVGHFLYKYVFVDFFGVIGTYIVIFSMLSISTLLTTEFLFFPFITRLKPLILEKFSRTKTKKSKPVFKERPKILENKLSLAENSKDVLNSETPLLKPVRETQRKISNGKYELPPLSLLKDPDKDAWHDIKENIEETSKILEEALRSFDVESRVVNVTRGPVITRYELELATGVKVNKILNLADDLSLVLKATQIRIAAPVPGKGVVGIEVPNKKKSHVFLKELIEKETEFANKAGLLLSLGKNIAGDPYFADLARMPHLLIAGTTGSGKSVCVNSIIINLLFKYTPEEVKFIIVDPKRVEMIGYDGIPHLLVPVIVEIKKASFALKWAAKEMENRYEMFARSGSRNIEEFNSAPPERKKYKENEEEKTMPASLHYIVIIIDELADLMMVARKEVEDTITRLAQMARAVGIHLILATQRPSVDVITGLIKANFPSRIAFQVSSRVDSRTILDANGAERLLGEGDMLFYSASTGAFKPIRIQGGYISNSEIQNVVEFVKTQGTPVYLDDILKMPLEEAENGTVPSSSDDPLFEDAVRIIQNSEVASVSLLQRKLKIGYNRASCLMDILESEGIVGPADGSKPRTILIRRDWFETADKDEEDS
ncbi:DNA translocase FtsK 4TM domain-containing protein [Candidatus Poribacteria bacterium]|nr:DNA translocase FtsK 4TM domain-containing protein [Candidatus Poribacteria bacterium]